MNSLVYYIFALTLLPMTFVHAAPLCQSVLQSNVNTISSESIASSIKQIAELKIRIDLAQSRGEAAVPALLAMKLQFPNKYRELVDALKHHLSEKEISESVKKEIRRLQKENSKPESEREHQDKKVQEAIEQVKPKSYKYELIEESIKATEAPVSGSQYIYLPESKSILHFNRREFLIYDLTTGRDQIIANAFAGTLMKDGHSFLLSTKEGFVIYDIRSKNLGPVLKFQFQEGREVPPQVGSIILSPSEAYAIITGYDQNMDVKPTSIIELKTGKEILSHEDLSDLSVNISFLNDQQIAILTKSNELRTMDLATKKIVEVIYLKQFHSVPYSTSTPVLSNDGSIITVFHMDGFISFNAKNLSETTGQNFIRQISHRTPIKAQGYPQAFLSLDYIKNISLFNMDTLDVEFDFGKLYQGSSKNANQMAVSPDGEQIAILYSDRDLEGRYVDIWKRKTN